MSQKCKFDLDCKNPNCSRQHSGPRTCNFDLDCKNPNCFRQHSSGRKVIAKEDQNRLQREYSDLSNKWRFDFGPIRKDLESHNLRYPESDPAIKWISVDSAGTRVRDDAWYYDAAKGYLHVAIVDISWLIDYEFVHRRPASYYDMINNVRERMLPSEFEQDNCFAEGKSIPALVAHIDLKGKKATFNSEMVTITEALSFTEFNSKAPGIYQKIFNTKMVVPEMTDVGDLFNKTFITVRDYPDRMCPARILIRAILDLYNDHATANLTAKKIKAYVHDDRSKFTSPLRDIFCFYNQYMIISGIPAVIPKETVAMYKNLKDRETAIDEFVAHCM